MKSISLSSSLSEINSQCEKIRQMHYMHCCCTHAERHGFPLLCTCTKLCSGLCRFFSPFSSTPLLRDVHLDGQVRSHKNSVIWKGCCVQRCERQLIFFNLPAWPGPSDRANPPSQTRDTQPGLLLFATCGVKCTGRMILSKSGWKYIYRAEWKIMLISTWVQH